MLELKVSQECRQRIQLLRYSWEGVPTAHNMEFIIIMAMRMIMRMIKITRMIKIIIIIMRLLIVRKIMRMILSTRGRAVMRCEGCHLRFAG